MPQPEAQRLFFALWPPPQVRRQLDRARLQMNAADARQVATENLHITLTFLGRVENNRLETLFGLMNLVQPPRCDLYLDSHGWFRQPRVGWIGCGHTPVEVTAFQQTLDQAIRECGFDLDTRPWKPHVTVYRKMRTAPVMVPFKPIRWHLDSYDLMVSEQRPGGVQYRSIRHRVANG